MASVHRAIADRVRPGFFELGAFFERRGDEGGIRSRLQQEFVSRAGRVPWSRDEPVTRFSNATRATNFDLAGAFVR
jgi:hypothetical protein